MDSAYLVSAENAWVAYPINRYESYQAFSTQRLSVDENSKVNSADKITARFYNAVPANDYATQATRNLLGTYPFQIAVFTYFCVSFFNDTSC